MCLSTVYEIVDGEENMIGECVTGIVTGEGSVSFTDILGEKTVVKGKIKEVDLVKNIVLIEAT